MKKSTIVVWAYLGVMALYTGYRTWHFLGEQMSGIGNDEIRVFLPLLFLFAAEVGIGIWHTLNMNHTTTNEQDIISGTMVWVDFVASLGAGVGDMIIAQSMIIYTVPRWLAVALIYGMPAVMALNIAAGLLFLSNDGQAKIEKGKKSLRFEIHRQALKELQDNQGQIAGSMKKDIYAQLRREVTQSEMKRFIRQQEKIDQGTPSLLNWNAETVDLGADGQTPKVDLRKVKK